MKNNASSLAFSEEQALSNLHRFLPKQNPLKDFIYQNTLASFESEPFHKALEHASTLFGYKTYMHIEEYRELYDQGRIKPDMLRRSIRAYTGKSNVEELESHLLHQKYLAEFKPRLGQLYQLWTTKYLYNLAKRVHSLLFRFVSSYIDQGVAMRKFPLTDGSFIEAVRELEAHSGWFGMLSSKRAKTLLQDKDKTLADLLHILVGDEAYYEQYLIDQQFGHPGWSGMVAVLEKNPSSLLDRREISLRDFIFFELLMEINALDQHFGEGKWQPLASVIPEANIKPFFAPIEHQIFFEALAIWQEAYEWSFFDQVLFGLTQPLPPQNFDPSSHRYDFQGIFCIDERECSLRRYVEEMANAQTFGAAGFFNVAFYFQPKDSKFLAKSCPPPVTPIHVVRETYAPEHHHKRDTHFSQESKNLVYGWAISHAMGWLSAIRLAVNIFKPTETPALVSSFKHMDKESRIQFENRKLEESKDGLKLGFTIAEMADRMETLLKCIGLTRNFAPIVYIIGHGASNVNNPHYTAYGCGACSGQTGSVNARVAAAMANKPEVRAILAQRGVVIPDSTEFVGALHDTTRDEMEFYDDEYLDDINSKAHQQHQKILAKALAYNAKERSRRFLLMNSNRSPEAIHEDVKLRSLSLFEPRSEWDHASNAMCIVARRRTTKHLFLDRRSFLHSYDFEQDPKGTYLLAILRAVVPVCGGINLQYYFSANDQYRFGAGSKLPHNVIGLVGVANGIDGDLRTGLPQQALDIHEPLRLMLVVEHYPELVLDLLKQDMPIRDLMGRAWLHFVVVDPRDRRVYQYGSDYEWHEYLPLTTSLPVTNDLASLTASSSESLPVYWIETKKQETARPS
ncbi:MAG: DUF2309 domain-containing protein [Cytophagales bacterium]|nr:MAG: DUF2309 domain-containing protein [Cytophagales bacterium]TAF59429.1 MAG: DUF2309 domain-containing protein [Cytophagales bacterium]